MASPLGALGGVLDNPLVQLLIGSTAPPKPLPPNASLKLRYELWLRDNHKWLLPVLDTFRSLTLFLPGRFQEGGASLTSEGIYTALNLISVFHDSLLDTPRTLTCELRVLGETGPARRHAWLRLAQNVLLTAHYTEVLIEMAAKARFPASPLAAPGAQSRRSWLVLCAVEAIKAYCRLSMLYANRGRMLTPPSQEEMLLDIMASRREKQKEELRNKERHEYEQELKKVAQQQQAALPEGGQPRLLTDGSSPTTASSSSAAGDNSVALVRATPSSDHSLLPVPPDALPPRSSFAPFALDKGHLPPLQVQALLDLYVRHGRQQSLESNIGRPHGRFVRQTAHPHESPSYKPPASEVVSEVLHLLRPVVYTAARAAFHRSPNSWVPWLLSLSVDAASRALAPRLAQLSKAEFEEVHTRMRNYLFYFLRDPMFSQIVANPLHRFCLLLNRIPLLGSVLSSMLSLVFSIQRYYFYTSAS